jgi:HEAT repeat protein
MMAEAVLDSADLTLWQRLLTCLALHRWRGRPDCHLRAEGHASARLDAALVSLFVEDHQPQATAVKLAVLHEGLTDPECRMRNAAATLLGLRGDPRGIDTLIAAAREGEPGCRLRAVAALGKLKDGRGGWALVAALASDDEPLHRQAAQALEELSRQATPALLEALKHPRQHVRWHAVVALGGLGDSPACAGLAEALSDADYGVRWAAADALAAIGEPAALPILERLSRCALTEGARQAAYHALRNMRSDDLQLRLRPVLEALHGPAAATEAPILAHRLLQSWR